MRDIQDFASLQIKLASPETIRAWSYGEVKKPETINYRTLRPERDGLFCERIFGTTKEWECYCGKFKSVRYKGVICDRCGVEVTHFKVRRERTGHIELAAPVSHIWYYRSVPSRMGLLLDLQVAALRSVLYYEKYIVIDAGDTDLKKNQLLTEDEFLQAQERYGGSFTAGMGAEAVKTLLENLDLDALAAELRAKMIEKGLKSDKRLLKRIEIVENFRASSNKASWMILDVIPVIPPDLRPMVQLDGGRFATSDLNDLYRRVINRNNRLKRLQQLSAPDIIIRNEKRMLQEAVDALFDNSKRKRVVRGSSARPLKSISDMLKGKQGRFRQNLLGKRVDYSGRSVIVVGPELKLWQCGLPEKMALELFRPFIMKKLVDKGVVTNIKRAKQLVDEENASVYAILDEVVREHPVMLNRAPTLHRLGIQAFEPVLVPGKAIKLHPLACVAFNADFDGDQMAIHVPLTQAAQMECWTLMLSARNLLDPANGNTIVYPRQDMVLGIYYMTSIKPDAKGTGKIFSSPDEVRLAAESKNIDWQALIKRPKASLSKPLSLSHNDQKDDDSRYVSTTAGRISFNESLPPEVDYYNEKLGDKKLKKLIEDVYHSNGPWLTIKMLDAVKEIGYKNATFYGASLSMDDIVIPDEKRKMLDEANKQEEEIIKQFTSGQATEDERYNNITILWNHTSEALAKKMMETFSKDKDGFNSMYMMVDSGARGSQRQTAQLASMLGLVAKPNGKLIELPIRSNFKEGLSVIEFFISTDGARKGLSDTALKTADAGYMTRRLVDVSQDVVINEDDCGTINGIDYTAIKDGETVIESLASRIAGHYPIERVIDPVSGEVLCDVNQYIDEDLAEKIDRAGVEKVKLRTVLTCESKHGICVKCYGKDLARNKIVEIGEAVGTVAAQSIGQPGTQLTLRTFHNASAEITTKDNHIVMKYPVLIRSVKGTHVVTARGDWLFTRKGSMNVTKLFNRYELAAGDTVLVQNGSRVRKDTPLISTGTGEVKASETGRIIISDNVVYITSNDQEIVIVNGSTIYAPFVQPNSVADTDQVVGEFDVFNEPIIAEQDGIIHYEDIIVGATLDEKVNSQSGAVERRISDLHLDVRQPRVIITDEDGNERGSYYLPTGAFLLVDDNQSIKAGVRLASIPKEAAKANDITGGIPRVTELFEARKPKVPAVLAQITGTVKFGKIVKGRRTILVEDEYGKQFTHLIPMTKRLIVRDGDTVKAGEELSDGVKDPRDILNILGENALQEYLMSQVQDVYRGQGVAINDKHIGIIIRQMLKKVEIVSVGDTRFIYGQQVDKYAFHEENTRVIKEGGQPAIARPMFQGITKAALATDSFVSASSFQETTRVLTNAAIAGSVDNLHGLKENVIIGHMIPAGTGMRQYHNVKLSDSSAADLDAKMEEILEQRRRERASEMQADEMPMMSSIEGEED